MSLLSRVGRAQVLALAARHTLSAAQYHDLSALAGLDAPPEHLALRSLRLASLLAAGLFGFGVLLWLAANWASIPRLGKFGLLQGLILAACLGAWLKPAARSPLLLLAFFAIGGLFAYFGQTYQTGADAWQLFALWAALSLPLVWAARSDVLWCPWMLVAMSAISLWVSANTGWQWRVTPAVMRAHYLGWAAAAALVMVSGPWSPVARAGGIGPWGLRTAALLACLLLLGVSLPTLFGRETALAYYVALLVCVAALAGLWRGERGDAYLMSMIGLTLDVLLICGFVKAFFDWRRDTIASFFTVGMLSATVVGLTVWAIMLRLRRDHERDARAEVQA